MQQYEAVTPVRCGKIFSPGQSIPDGILSDRDLKILLELGSIKATIKDIPSSSSTPLSEEATEVSTETPPLSVLDYVNSADEAGLGKIKGVGKTTAKAMASHGTFASIDELKALVPNVNWDSIQIEGSK